MTDNRTTELLKDYAFALRRLEYAVDKPGSNMTLGEYEAEEKRVTDEYAQAIAATLGSERDAIYNAGFDNGIKAVLHQLDGLLIKTDSAVEIQDWVDEQWKELES